ncbi:hypothetical protein JCM24511_08441 [Saitozyma sp. JCM 24511]|nr:hypothetical protein JCM24511_08441 [Saitozyma sp. JCM 24511]
MGFGPASIVFFLGAVTAVSATLTNGNGQTWGGCSFQLPANTVRIGAVPSGAVCAGGGDMHSCVSWDKDSPVTTYRIESLPAPPSRLSHNARAGAGYHSSSSLLALQQATCQAQSPAYQYAFASALTSTTVTCFCGNTGIGMGFYVPYNEATCYSLDFISQYVTSTSFVFQSCAGGTSSSSPTHQPDVASCFVACAPSSLIMYLVSDNNSLQNMNGADTVWPLRRRREVHDIPREIANHKQGNTGDCYCPFTQQTTYPDCSNMGYAFSHPGGSAISRRRRRDQLALGRLAATQLCAAGHSACRLRSDSDTYECLDTQSELESCGGCLWGEVIPESRPTTDTDVHVHANTTLVPRSGIESKALLSRAKE